MYQPTRAGESILSTLLTLFVLILLHCRVLDLLGLLFSGLAGHSVDKRSERPTLTVDLLTTDVSKTVPTLSA